MSHLRKKIKDELKEVRETLDRVLACPAIRNQTKGLAQHKVAYEEIVFVRAILAGILKLIELELADFDSP